MFYPCLRVQNEQFSEEKGVILRYTEKEVRFPPGFEPPVHGFRSELFTTELSDLLMIGHKIAYINSSCECKKVVSDIFGETINQGATFDTYFMYQS